MLASNAYKPSDTIASLDGIRALAISLVFAAHGGLSEIVPGGLGVTIFFVLSGFLITTLMRVEFATTGALDLRAFYLRRFFRLMPPLLLVVLLMEVLQAAGHGQHGPTPVGVASVIFYFSNIYSISKATGIPDGLGVTWSLAVEEHFYIVFPLLAVVLLRWRRGAAASALGLLCAAILGWRCWLVAHGVDDNRIYLGTDTRIDAILVGCILSLLRNPVLDPVPRWARQHTVAIALAAVAVLIGTLMLRAEQFRFSYRFTIQALAIAPLIYLAVAQPGHAVFRWLNAAPLVYLGRISYTVYLTHQGCLFLIQDRWPALGMVPMMALTAAMVLAIAVPMRVYVELPCAGIRRRLQKRRPSARATVPVTA